MNEQLDRIEQKLDRLISLLDEFGPLLKRYRELSEMKPAQRVKELLKNGKQGQGNGNRD